MALIKCKECQKEISSAARMCVHCGYPDDQTVFVQDLGVDGTFFRLIILIGIVILFGGFWYGMPTAILGFAITFSGIVFLLIRALR